MRDRRFLPAHGAIAALILAGCQGPAPAGPWAAGGFSLDRLSEPTPSGDPAVRVSGAPGASGTAGAAGARPTPRATASPTMVGAVGGMPAEPVVRGRVVDEAGRPLDGARIEGAGRATETGADGTFALALIAGETLLTASAPGFASQTGGPPYGFVLPARSITAAAPFDVAGITSPPLADARVMYADAAGTIATGVTDASGRFRFSVVPVGPAGAGMLAVHRGLAIESVPRYRLQQAPAEAWLGAVAAVAGTESTVPVARADGAVRIEPQASVGLLPAGATLSLVGPTGLSVPLVGGEGAWPAQVGMFDVPGFSLALALHARPTSGEGLSVTERADLRKEPVWRPGFLELPVLAAEPAAPGRLRWRHAGRRSALAIYPAGRVRPVWEAVVDGEGVGLPTLPADEGGYEVEVQAWDLLDVPFPSSLRAPKGDRRWASRRVAL